MGPGVGAQVCVCVCVCVGGMGAKKPHLCFANLPTHTTIR